MIRTPAPPASTGGARIATFALLAACALAVACGKKGPPLPPLVRVPAPPGDFVASRRGAEVDLEFTVPNANTDGSRPANVERVDVYAFTAPSTVATFTDDQLVKLATKVQSVPVKAPRDPDLAIEPDEPTDDMEPPEGQGLDQGARAHVEEQLSGAALAPIETASGTRTSKAESRPLLGLAASSVRTYAIVAVTPRGRKGPLSRRVRVPLDPPPPPPAPAKIDYDETAVTITWSPPLSPAWAQTSGGQDVLPSKPVGVAESTIAYNVYEAAPAPDGGAHVETRLTPSPITETTFKDTRMVWDVERCYVIRTVQLLGELSVESDAPAPACRRLVDTFPPAAPQGLRAVPGQGYISLIWQPNTEKDLAGYLVFRGIGTGETLDQITPAPIQDSTFTDNVPAGVHCFYAVKAIDRAGNVSPMSNRDEGTARE